MPGEQRLPRTEPTYQKTRFAVAMVLGIISIAAVVFVASLYKRFVPGYAVLIALAASALSYVGILINLYRHRLAAAVVAMVIGVTIYTTLHGMNYLHFRYQAIESLIQARQIDYDEAERALNQSIYASTGSTGMTGYLRYVTRGGSILSTRSRSLEVKLDQSKTQLIWIVELLIVALLPAVIMVLRKTRKSS